MVMVVNVVCLCNKIFKPFFNGVGILVVDECGAVVRR